MGSRSIQLKTRNKTPLFYSLEIIDVELMDGQGWAIFRYFRIDINNCAYSLFGSLYLRLDNTDLNIALSVHVTSFEYLLELIRSDGTVLNIL